ncbi:SRPBCC family protein [Streptomyces sp. H27-H1]|uniref:SRPBCC family protein n=1 Tax=Streptomyces sp. H27-H1 TaxID=2996461 RepID=UPI00226DB426|nr:SRPBCC family protein [Streptomyces sp. H27-H1]MCY0926314.1 SRPBCC family protein [Streptomyces sp. H27-H1]
MPAIRIIRRTVLAPEEAWRRLTDWERHGAVVPLTRAIIETPPPTHTGTRFTMRTGVGRITFDDPMEVTFWQPPRDGSAGLVRLVKHGRAVRGRAELELRPSPAGGCEAQWREELHVRGLGRPFDPLVATAARLLFTRALEALLRP